jgi:hypothetical protein
MIVGALFCLWVLMEVVYKQVNAYLSQRRLRIIAGKKEEK